MVDLPPSLGETRARAYANGRVWVRVMPTTREIRDDTDELYYHNVGEHTGTISFKSIRPREGRIREWGKRTDKPVGDDVLDEDDMPISFDRGALAVRLEGDKTIDRASAGDAEHDRNPMWHPSAFSFQLPCGISPELPRPLHWTHIAVLSSGKQDDRRRSVLDVYDNQRDGNNVRLAETRVIPQRVILFADLSGEAIPAYYLARQIAVAGGISFTATDFQLRGQDGALNILDELCVQEESTKGDAPPTSAWYVADGNAGGPTRIDPDQRRSAAEQIRIALLKAASLGAYPPYPAEDTERSELAKSGAPKNDCFALLCNLIPCAAERHNGKFGETVVVKTADSDTDLRLENLRGPSERASYYGPYDLEPVLMYIGPAMPDAVHDSLFAKDARGLGGGLWYDMVISPYNTLKKVAENDTKNGAELRKWINAHDARIPKWLGGTLGVTAPGAAAAVAGGAAGPSAMDVDVPGGRRWRGRSERSSTTRGRRCRPGRAPTSSRQPCRVPCGRSSCRSASTRRSRSLRSAPRPCLPSCVTAGLM
jgi:hypothetical protein